MHRLVKPIRLLLVLFFSWTLLVQADVSSSSLRASFGSPLRASPQFDVFLIRPGVELAVSYSTSGRVCRLEITPLTISRKESERILQKAVPFSERGEKRGRFLEMAGGGAESIYYNKFEFFFQVWDQEAANEFLATESRLPEAVVIARDTACGWKASSDPSNALPR